MDLKREKDKKRIKSLFKKIGLWSGKVKESYFKNGEEISSKDAEKDKNISKRTEYISSNGEVRYVLSSNGEDTILTEYDNGIEIEKFIIPKEDILDLLDIN